jgi:plasmid stabilization system protein ParE
VQLEWSKRSLADRERIFTYYWNSVSERLADEVEEAIVSRARNIASLKMVYRKGEGSTRECVMRRFPFTLIYRIEPGKVRIVRVLHQARDYFTR